MEHCLERLSQKELQEVVLPHWFSLLAPSGQLKITTNDADDLLAGYTQGRVPLAVLRDQVLGDGTGRGARRNLFTPSSLETLLVDAGFADVRRVVDPRVEHDASSLTLVARRGEVR